MMGNSVQPLNQKPDNIGPTFDSCCSNSSSFCCSGVRSCCVDAISSQILPISVFPPVATTTPTAFSDAGDISENVFHNNNHSILYKVSFHTCICRFQIDVRMKRCFSQQNTSTDRKQQILLILVDSSGVGNQVSVLNHRDSLSCRKTKLFWLCMYVSVCVCMGLCVCLCASVGFLAVCVYVSEDICVCK